MLEQLIPRYLVIDWYLNFDAFRIFTNEFSFCFLTGYQESDFTVTTIGSVIKFDVHALSLLV